MRNTACSNTAFLDGNRESEDSKAFGIFDVVLAVPAGGSRFEPLFRWTRDTEYRTSRVLLCQGLVKLAPSRGQKRSEWIACSKGREIG